MERGPCWQCPASNATFSGMETAPLPGDSARLESAVAKQRRLAPEAELLAEAFADVAAGRIVDEAEVDAWIDSLGTDHELPLPRSDR